MKGKWMLKKQFIRDAVAKLRAGDVDAWADIKPLQFPETDFERKYTDFDDKKYSAVLAELSVTSEELSDWEMRYHEGDYEAWEDAMDRYPNYDWIKGEPHPKTD